MIVQVICYCNGIVTMALHPQGQRLNTLQYQECIKGADRSSCISQRHSAGAANICRRTQCLSIYYAMISGLRIIQHRETLWIFRPWKLAGIDDDAAQRGAVPLSQWRSILKGSVSIPCNIRNALKGLIAAPVFRRGTVRARPIYAAGPSASVYITP